MWLLLCSLLFADVPKKDVDMSIVVRDSVYDEIYIAPITILSNEPTQYDSDSTILSVYMN